MERPVPVRSLRPSYHAPCTWPVPGGARAGPRPRPPAVGRAWSLARAHGTRAQGLPRDTRMLAALAYGYDPDLGQAPARAL